MENFMFINKEIGLTFEEIWNVCKTKKIFTQEYEMEMALEMELQLGNIVCIEENNVNRFYRV